MPLAKVKKKGEITIPADIREALGLDIGDYVEITREGDRIVLTPMEIVERDPVIDEALAEALEDERAGRISPAFKTAEEIEAWQKTEDFKKFIAKK